ncbi:hypothetical protein ACFYO2_10345 [Streptomyces sp. NPDC006602]
MTDAPEAPAPPLLSAQEPRKAEPGRRTARVHAPTPEPAAAAEDARSGT